MRRRCIPADAEVRVVLSAEEVFDIRTHTFLAPGLLSAGIEESDGALRFSWSLEDIEQVLGHVAASANHSKGRKLEKRLDRIYAKLQDVLERC